MEQKEVMVLYGSLRLVALAQLIEEYAYKNRAKMVQRLLELKHKEEEKLELNRALGAQYGQQNSTTKGLQLGANSHITNNDNGGSS